MSLVEQRLSLSPPDWDRRRIKHHVSRFLGGGTPSKDREEFWTNGTIPWVSPKDMKRRWIDNAEDWITEDAVLSSATSIVPLGSVLMVVRSGILKHSLPVAINTVPVALNQDLKAFGFRRTLLPEFFAYWVEGQASNLILEWCQMGATVDNINVDAMLNTWIALPDRKIQRAIADFLDRETARIDQLIEKKQRLVELLEEKQHSLTERLVAFGPDGTAVKIDTGNIWLPRVAKGTRLLPIKRVSRLINGYAFSSDDLGDYGVPVLRIGDVKTSININAAKRFTGEIARNLDKFVVRRGDILIAMTGATIGKFGIYESDARAYLNQRVGILRAHEINRKFLGACLATRTFVEQMKLFAYGGAQPNIGAGEIGSILIPVPSLDSQNAVTELIDVEARAC